MKGLKKILIPFVAGTLALGSCQQDKINELENQVQQDSIIISNYTDTVMQYSAIIKENDSTIYELVQSNQKKDSLIDNYKEDTKVLKNKLYRVQRQKRDLSRKLKKYDGTDIDQMKKEYVKLENEYSNLRNQVIRRDSEIKYLKREIKRQNDVKWKAGDKPWNFQNKTKSPRFSKINGEFIEFKDNYGIDMQAYVKFGNEDAEIELKRVNQGFRGATFELPEKKELVESVTFYAIDRDGNKSKAKTFKAKEGYVYRGRIK